MERHPDEKGPAKVAQPKQAGDAKEAKRAVWTERMLAALETGVKGGKWYSLMDKVWQAGNLEAGWERVRKNKGSQGVDGETIRFFEANLDRELAKLREELQTGRYVPRSIKRKEIPKPGRKETRPIGIPAVRDRIVQTALRNVIEPIFEKEFVEDSYGFRPKRGCKDALRVVQSLLRQGATWVVEVDIQKCFDTIPRKRLMADVEERIADGRILELIEAYLNAGVMDGLRTFTPEEGTPQGAVISPLLANIYLHPVDVRMNRAGYRMVRYADDMVVLCRSGAEASEAMEMIRSLLEERGLQVHPEKTKVGDATQPGGFDFLGYHFEQGKRWPRTKSLSGFKEKIRAKTKRTNGKSLKVIIREVNASVRGWFEYFKHSHQTTFRPLDQWIRMRLRSILRKRQGKRGRGRGSDHQRWPNTLFRSEGLISMHQAHLALCQAR